MTAGKIISFKEKRKEKIRKTNNGVFLVGKGDRIYELDKKEAYKSESFSFDSQEKAIIMSSLKNTIECEIIWSKQLLGELPEEEVKYENMTEEIIDLINRRENLQALTELYQRLSKYDLDRDFEINLNFWDLHTINRALNIEMELKKVIYGEENYKDNISVKNLIGIQNRILEKYEEKSKLTILD